MSVSINGDNGLTFNDGSTQATAATGFGFKNRIINGAMVIDQRNNGASVTATAGQYTLDRWQLGITVSSKVSVQQNAGSVTPPTGFSNYLGVTSTSAYSLVAGDRIGLFQPIEGFNTADLGWGSVGAQSITMSFWVRSSLTGTFGGVVANGAYNRAYVYSYTINAANTWEYKTVTIPGDTTGSWLTNNSTGIAVSWAVGVHSGLQGTPGSWSGTAAFAPTGQVNVAGTNGATFYITGVQLEKGSTATSFDYRPYGTELALCQRYYQQSQQAINMHGYNTASGQVYGYLAFPVYMRASPTSSSTYSSLSAAAGKTVTPSVQGVVFGIDATAGGVFSGAYASGNTFNAEL
jgi:hypothetical protein